MYEKNPKDYLQKYNFYYYLTFCLYLIIYIRPYLLKIEDTCFYNDAFETT